MSATVTNWTPVGGVFKHVEYKMEVNLDGAFWEVYRRYKTFDKLDAAIRNVLGPVHLEEKGFEPALPAKDLPYSVGGGSSTALDKRIRELNKYLTDIIAYSPPEKHKETIRGHMREFLDTENRGKSGVRVSLEARGNGNSGGASVVREAFGLVAKPSTFNLVYQGVFIALTNEKVLYICSNVYDKADRAKHCIPLNMGGYRTIPCAANKFDLSGNGLQLSFKFVNEHDAAHWMRAIGDATQADVVQRTTDASRRAGQQQAHQQQQAQQQQQAAEDERRRAEATAVRYNTKDDLSANFGV